MLRLNILVSIAIARNSFKFHKGAQSGDLVEMNSRSTPQPDNPRFVHDRQHSARNRQCRDNTCRMLTR